MLSLLDGDLIAFRCAASCENETEGILRYRINDLLERIFATTGADKYFIYLSGENNNRKLIDPEYKANRLDKPRPKYLGYSRDFLQDKYSALRCTNDWEADDAMGVAQCTLQKGTTVICSLDKDMLMIPGQHYNWHKDIFTTVTEHDGLVHFYKQLLIGDNADNIKGVRGIGEIKAERIMRNLDTEQEMYEMAKDLYEGEDIRFFRNCNLLWIHRNKDETWTDRSSHLSMSEDDIQLAKGVLLPLKPSRRIPPCSAHGLTEEYGTEPSGT